MKMIKAEQSGNGHDSYILNRDVSQQPELITVEKIKIMDYLFKEVDLENEDDFKELGREFPE